MKFSSKYDYAAEDLRQNLTGVTDLKLEIIPDIAGGAAVATLRIFRVV